MARPHKVYAKLVQFGVGVEMMGSSMSIDNRRSTLEVTPIGVKTTSKKNGRTIIVPWANIKACELVPVLDEVIED